MVLIELVYCRITGRTRDLPKVHHFIPLVPWSCKKIKGKKKVMPPSAPDGSKEQIKLVLDMSNEGPIFKMLDSILKGSSGEGNDALSKLLKSGIPGLENLFSGKDFKFEKMSDEDKKRFLDAVTGAEGKINSKAAAALIAAAASGGDPEIANKIIEKMMSGLGDEIDPAMMAALMATTALVAQGATNEEILHAMQRELSNTGLTSDEILAKTMVLQRAMAGDNSPAFINKTLKNALYVANISTKDLAKTLLAEKVIYQSGGTPEDIAKCMLIQSLLSKLGLSNDLIINAMKALVRKDTSASVFEPRGKPSPISSLGDEGITQNDVLSVVKLLKALEQRKVRGMKDIISLIEEVGDNVKTETDVINLLEKLVLSGLVKLPDINRTLSIEQKFSSSGVSNVKDLSRSLLLQKIMSENGMTEYEISSAMSLILMIEGLVTSSEFDASISDADEKCLDLVLSIYEELIDPKIPPESIRLMRKAMKQRRGSVENVAETLMLALAADGESHESIARAMVKALKTTGASPEEISRTISQSLEKFGMSQDEIAQIIAQAVADSGASASDVAKALKHTFASAIKDDPANAAELVRYMAETLAASGATPEEIAKAMHETLLESLSAGNEKLLEVADSVARTMTDAGASAQDIAAALKMAMKAASGNVGSNIIQELAVTMAKAMISSNASVDETIQAIRESLEMAGCSPDEIAECLVVALASSGADPTKTAETIQEILSNAGFNEEEVQQKILESMLESGTSVGDIAQTLAKQKLLSFIGKSPTDVSKSLLKLLRSGDKINKEAIQSTLKSGGLDPTSAGKALLFQKALKSLGLDSKTVVAFISLQKEMMNEGKSPKEIASLLEKLVGSSPAEKDVQKLIQDLSSIELSAEDIMSLSDLETEVNRSSKKSSKPPEQAMKDLIEISSKKNMSPSNLILIQKLVNRLGISLTDVAKLSAIQKDMYESGASPQDIALALSPALPGPEFIGEGLKDSLMKKMEACDVNDCVDLSDAVKGANMSTDLMSKIILIQSTIEAQIISPEKSSEEFCKLTQGVRANKEELSSIFKKILSQNGVSPETLKKLITFEKAIGLCGTESETIFALNDFVKTFAQNFGADEKSVEDTLRKLFFKEDVYKSIGKKVNDCLSSSESSKMSKSELSSLSQLFEKIKNPGFSSSSISIDSSNDLEAMLLIALQDHPLLGGSEKGLENLSQILFFRDLFSELSIEKSKEMGNGMRILNKIWKDGDPLSVFETLQEVIGNNLEPFDLKLLQKVISGQVMPSTSTLTQFSSSLTAKSKLNLNSADDEFMDQIFNSALNMASLSDDDISKAMLVQKVLSASGVSPEVLAQVMAFQKEMLASGTSYQELAAVLEKMSGGKSEDLVEFLQNVINGTMTNFENKDVENLMKLTASLGQSDASFLKGMDPQMIAKALMVQKLLSSANLDPQDLGKVMFLQQSFVEAGSSYDKIAACMERSLFKSGMTLEHMLTLIEIELKSSGTGGRKSRLSAREIKSMLSFNHVLGSGTAAVNVMRKLNPDLLKLLETTVKYDSSSGSNFEELLSVMEDNFGPAVFQQKTIDALVVNAFMEKAGASKDEVEELMLMMMNKGGGVSHHFVNSIQEIMKIGGNMDMKLDALKLAMEEESNSLVNSLRNVFMCKDPTSEDLMSIGNTIAMKLNADNASKNDVKLALIDILDEALQDVLDYELDSNLIFNYLMLASLAMTTHMLEEKGGDLTGESIQSTSKEEIINLLERLLQEAELQSEVPKLAVYGKSFEGIKELLDILLSNESTRSALKRQVAFLFNFEEIENTTVLGLTLQEILKESKHILRPWDILKHRKILGLKTAKVPKLTYSQVYCFYKVLPEHTDGPPIGLSYE